MRLRFLHTSDWQLGVTRHFLDAASVFYGRSHDSRVRSTSACAVAI